METVEQVAEFKERTRKIFEELNYDLHPRWPWVLVRIIPKDQEVRIGSGRKIYLPEKNQNKPNWEGQVLRTYGVYRLEKCVDSKVTVIEHRASVEPGDHVVFEHWVGVPVPELCHDWRKGEYRLIKETDILAVVEYRKISTRDRIRNVLNSCNQGQEVTEEAVCELMERAEIIFHEQSRTLSGV